MFDPAVNVDAVTAADVIVVFPVFALRSTLNAASIGVVSYPLFSVAFDCTYKLSTGMLTPPPALSKAKIEDPLLAYIGALYETHARVDLF